ncbi:hypothetical protein [Streptococcus ferus]|uniref:hypothetical protein n=1 Tax=Streptococcus ferus TaxID=1345 RepID=UPI00359F3CE6
MVFNNDWLLNQIRGTANMIGKVFKLENILIDLGVVEDEEGRTINGNDYLNQLIIDEKFDLATKFIHSQMKRLSTYEYNHLVDVYIVYLKSLDNEIQEKNHINSESIQEIKNKLRNFSW